MASAMRVVAIAGIAMACLAAVVSAQRPNMMIGTRDGLEDVMLNGVLQAPWATTPGQTLAADPSLIEYWAWINADTGSDRLHLVFLEDGAHPSYDAVAQSQDVHVAGGHPPLSSAIPLQFYCKSNNDDIAAQTAALDVTFLDSPTVPPSRMYFTKVCRWPLLNIGMNENTASIYHSGQPVFWDYRASPDDDISKFWAWLDETNPYNALHYSIAQLVYDDSVVQITRNVNEAARKLSFIGAPESTVILQYACTNTVPFSQTNVHLTLNIGWRVDASQQIQFNWLKQCSASHMMGPRHGFDIGTQPGLGDIVKNGVVQHDWGYWSDGIQKKILYDLQELTFYTFINESDIGQNPRTQDYNLTYVTEILSGQTNTFYDIIATNTSSIQTARVGSYVIHSFKIVCKSDGTANTRVYLTIPAYGQTSFFFQKTCTFPKLEIGTEEKKSNIAKDGKVIPWTDNNIKGGSASFYFWLPDGDVVKSQHYQVHDYYCDHNIFASCSWRYNGENIARPDHLGTPESSITFLYQCKAGGGVKGYSNVTIDIGWADSHLSWSWYMQCGTAPTPDEPGGWSAFGIFSFTVFLLTLIGCLGGCMYNYFGPSAKRGLAVVPGHRYYVACYEKMVTPKAYTPQSSDYTYNAAEEKAGHGYQTDL